MRVYFWTVNPIRFIFMILLMPVQPCLDCSFVVTFELKSINPPTLFFSFKTFWLFIHFAALCEF